MVKEREPMLKALPFLFTILTLLAKSWSPPRDIHAACAPFGGNQVVHTLKSVPITNSCLVPSERVT